MHKGIKDKGEKASHIHSLNLRLRIALAKFITKDKLLNNAVPVI
jgi:hypothetical protein